MTTPTLIGIDWGTSSFRASLIDADGGTLESREDPSGILAIQNRDFEGFLKEAIDDWMCDFPDTPIIASGMITSRNGWLETPYASLPLGIKELAGEMVKHRTQDGRTIHFITGCSQDPNGERPDVIRGEETELIGYLTAHGLESGIFLLPGTHNKWLRVEDGRITQFVTHMTGEVYSLLGKHSILAFGEETTPFCEDAFLRGLTAVKKRPGSLLSNIFTTRTLSLFGNITKEATADYLSGVLIGEEFLSSLRVDGSPPSLTIIGRQDLSLRYQKAAEFFGIPSTIATPGLSQRGQLAIARSAELVP
ncbi:2-dehydro-3-deoxygalactonokinase [Halomonas nitroreducens]|uniref:2-dehydro-3-deoxygalactonokinase n=1 Tax=Halomonas nitroreducens TaxID=447425 RepID=A0A431UZE4_9GAMM|nr:2-dehydro-3-deoxygalactonokinase [Halomonas nitroreducens]RTQ99586.1 2-dehydro-3-deoxygalactonokinase [Halomonas nitroreducens]